LVDHSTKQKVSQKNLSPCTGPIPPVQIGTVEMAMGVVEMAKGLNLIEWRGTGVAPT